MKHLYAPWREAYFKDEKVKNSCVFCTCAQEKELDDELGVFLRLKHCFGVMNKYPYTTGHVMIIPYLHEKNIEELPEPVWLEMSRALRALIPIIKEVLRVPAVNIGMNLGEAAGAGIAAHCHYHIVPRKGNDSNFITTIAHTRVIVKQTFDICLLLREACKDFKLDKRA